VPLLTLSQTAAAEHAAALNARGGILRAPPGSGILNNNKSAATPSPFAPSSPGAAATVVVSNLGESSGKAVTDRLRQLLPGLPLCGYRREGPPGAPQDADRSREVVVVELGSGEAAAALLERAARRPDAIHPFQIRAGVGVATSLPPAFPSTLAAAPPSSGALSAPPPGLSYRPPPQQQQQQPVSSSTASEGGGGEAAGGRWGHSVLAGRLKPRTAPLPPSAVATTERPTLASMIEQQQRKKPAVKMAKARKGGGAGVNGKLAAAEEELTRPGHAVRSNRWEGLLSDSDEEREEEEGKAAAGRQAQAATEEEGEEEGQEQQAASPVPAPAAAAIPSPPLSEQEEEGDEEGEDEEEEEEEEEEEIEIACKACTYVYFSADFCPICHHPRK
jgi:hypothetical protein